MKTLSVKVKPNARASALEQVDGVWLAQIKSPPVDGKANAELIALVAEKFRCRKAQVSIKAGAGSRTKLVRIEDQAPSPPNLPMNCR
jgi:uncharacterized protein (TIGR00251 family)